MGEERSPERAFELSLDVVFEQADTVGKNKDHTLSKILNT